MKRDGMKCLKIKIVIDIIQIKFLIKNRGGLYDSQRKIVECE